MPAIIRFYLQKRREGGGRGGGKGGGRSRVRYCIGHIHGIHGPGTKSNWQGGGYDMLSERKRIPLGNFDVNKKPTYGSVIIGTESRDISREIYVKLARSFLLVVDHPLCDKRNRFVRLSLETLLSNTMTGSKNWDEEREVE